MTINKTGLKPKINREDTQESVRLRGALWGNGATAYPKIHKFKEWLRLYCRDDKPCRGFARSSFVQECP